VPRACRDRLNLDGTNADLGRLEALFVLALTVALRPGELRALTWEHLDLDNSMVHVWRSARNGGDTKRLGSRRFPGASEAHRGSAQGAQEKPGRRTARRG
jgi:integrase